MGSSLIPILVLILVLLPSSTPISYDDNVDWGLEGVGEWVGAENGTMIHRSLVAPGRQRYISYAALAANNIPCGQRGKSYYDCNKMAKANPYSRGCSVITRCARDNS